MCKLLSQLSSGEKLQTFSLNKLFTRFANVSDLLKLNAIGVLAFERDDTKTSWLDRYLYASKSNIIAEKYRIITK